MPPQIGGFARMVQLSQNLVFNITDKSRSAA